MNEQREWSGPDINAAHFVAKALGVRLIDVLSAPVEVVLAMSRRLNAEPRYKEALQNLVWAWDQREGVGVAHKKARAVLEQTE